MALIYTPEAREEHKEKGKCDYIADLNTPLSITRTSCPFSALPLRGKS